MQPVNVSLLRQRDVPSGRETKSDGAKGENQIHLLLPLGIYYIRINILTVENSVDNLGFNWIAFFNKIFRVLLFISHCKALWFDKLKTKRTSWAVLDFKEKRKHLIKCYLTKSYSVVTYGAIPWFILLASINHRTLCENINNNIHQHMICRELTIQINVCRILEKENYQHGWMSE